MSACKRCGAQIRWAKTDRGKFVPFNVDPTADGTHVLIKETEGAPPVPSRFADLDPILAVAWRERFHLHSTTCGARPTTKS